MPGTPLAPALLARSPHPWMPGLARRCCGCRGWEKGEGASVAAAGTVRSSRQARWVWVSHVSAKAETRRRESSRAAARRGCGGRGQRLGGAKTFWPKPFVATGLPAPGCRHSGCSPIATGEAVSPSPYSHPPLLSVRRLGLGWANWAGLISLDAGASPVQPNERVTMDVAQQRRGFAGGVPSCVFAHLSPPAPPGRGSASDVRAALLLPTAPPGDALTP